MVATCDLVFITCGGVQVANPGFRFDYQLIDVGDFNGVGESAPTPHFYQVHIREQLEWLFTKSN